MLLNLHKGWFTLDAAVYVFRSGLHQHRDRKFSISLQKRNRLLQMHTENAFTYESVKLQDAAPYGRPHLRSDWRW